MVTTGNRDDTGSVGTSTADPPDPRAHSAGAPGAGAHSAGAHSAGAPGAGTRAADQGALSAGDPYPGTASRILDVAESLVQTRGFNGFSYADVAAYMKITKAALHYHFATKADLGETLVARYAARFAAALGAVDSTDAQPAAKLEAYACLYLDVLRNKRMCLCGMLAAEYQTLPEPMRAAVLRFFEINENWLQEVLQHGRAAGNLQFEGSARDAARTMVGSLEGAMLVARTYGDIDRFRTAARSILAAFAPPSGAVPEDRVEPRRRRA